jgi:pantoate--beta-alanine ligase
MASDLNLPVEIRVGATLRDADGLAMSSRNTRLAPTARTKALGLPRGLEMANRAFKEGEHSSMKLIELVANELLVHEGVELDYCDVIKLAGFQEVENADDGCVLAAAVFVDGVRLIDHVYLGRDQLPVSVEV